MLATTRAILRVLCIVLFIGTTQQAKAQPNLDANLYYTHGVEQMRLDKPNKAIKWFKKSLRALPKHDASMLMLIKIYLMSEEEEKAVALIQRLEEVKPTNQERTYEKEFYLAYKQIIDKAYRGATIRLKNLVTQIHADQDFDFFLLSRCYNALGYIEIIQYCNEFDTKVVKENVLRSANFLFEQALRYNKRSTTAGINYNTVNTALNRPPRIVIPYKITDFKGNDGAFTETFVSQSKAYYPTNSELVPRNTDDLIETLDKYQQLLVMVDGSGSMRQPANANTPHSRFEVMKNLVNYVLNTTKKHTQIGIISVSGQCEEAPLLKYPTTTDRAKVFEVLANLEADGHTPVNNALEEAMALFDSKGENRAILFLTDGMESCDPNSTCELAAMLGLEDIAIHIVTFLNEEGHESEYQSYTCMSSSTDGSIQTVTDNSAVKNSTFEFIMEERLVVPKLQKKKEETSNESVAFAY